MTCRFFFIKIDSLCAHVDSIMAFLVTDLVMVGSRFPFMDFWIFLFCSPYLADKSIFSCREMYYTTKVLRMHSRPYAKKKGYWAYIKDLGQHCW